MAAKTPLTHAQRTPPAAVAEQAEKGLELRKTHSRGGAEGGVRCARQPARRKAASSRDVRSMYSYVARHQIDERGKNWGDRDKPSAGYIAWHLWGGEAGKLRIDPLHASVDKAEGHA